MNFDAECRKLFLEIAQRNGVQVECEPVYGGAGYLEKQDFIIENQKKRIAEKQAVLDEITMRVLDMENFVEQVAEDAYEKRVRQYLIQWQSRPERKILRSFADIKSG